MNKRIYLPAVLLVVPFATVFAQEQMPLPQPGERIRLMACTPVCEDLEGTCEALSGDTLRVRIEERATPTAISLASVLKLEVHRGQKSNVGTGAIMGFVLGAAAGAIAGVVFCSNEHCSGVTPGQAALYAGAVAGAGGAVLGAGLGALTKRDRWEEVPLDRLRVSVVPRRDGVALGISIAF